MLYSPDTLREKLTLFWHGHFATGAEKVLDAQLMYEQNELLAQVSTGGFSRDGSVDLQRPCNVDLFG